MQTTSTTFDSLAQGNVRPLSWALRASFDKQFDPDIDFFILSSDDTPMSLLNGGDLLQPDDDNVIQEWDKYDYTDYTDRVISLETTHEIREPFSVASAMADIKLNNFDDYFTPNSGSPIQDYILPRRPVRIFMGFNGENLPQFVGLTETVPITERSTRQSSVHAIDFLSYIYEKDISETTILEDVSTSEILDYLFQFVGLTDDQYNLDIATNLIPFFYVEKGTKIGDVISKIVQADIGFLYMDELGVITYKNRYNFSSTPVDTLDESNIIDYTVSTEQEIINSVKVTADVREVQDAQSIWSLSEPISVPFGATVDVWLDFDDPVTTKIDPTYSATEIASSYFTANLNADGTGTYTNIDLISIDLFSKSAKLVFENVGVSNGYITALDLWGTPAKIVDNILYEEQDATSVLDYEEQLVEINNEYIQDFSTAQTIGVSLINDYKNYGSVLDLEVKGNMAYQLGDAIIVDIDGYNDLYLISKITNIFSDNRFTQRLTVRVKEVYSFFILSSDDTPMSLLDGDDVLGI